MQGLGNEVKESKSEAEHTYIYSEGILRLLLNVSIIYNQSNR